MITASSATPTIDDLLAAYHADGFIRLRSVFTPQEIESWRAECDRLLHADFVDPRNGRTPFRFNSGDTPERIDPLIDVSPVFAQVVRDERFLAVLRSIFADEPSLFKDKLIFKLPGTDGYTMHQDQAWWQLCTADDILSVSIMIDGSNAANGCIELFPGYHDRLLTPEGLKSNLRAEELAQVDPAKGQKMDTLPGDVLIFHSLAPHQSARNLSQEPRRSLYLTYNAARSGDLYEDNRREYIARSSREKATEFFR